MEKTIPVLPEDIVRMNCLTLAHDYADEPDIAMAIAMSFVEFVENGCAGICQPCMKAMRE